MLGMGRIAECLDMTSGCLGRDNSIGSWSREVSQQCKGGLQLPPGLGTNTSYCIGV